MTPYYQDKWVAIYHGDCREVLPQLDVAVDLVLTDPPYGVDFRGNDWDKTIPIWFDNLRSISPTLIFTSAIRTMWNYPKPDWVLCWLKPASNSRSDLGGFNGWTPLLVYGKPRFPVDYINLHAIQHSYDKIGHPSPKPEALFLWAISNASAMGNRVLDPFLGSGTTCYCAKKLNRYSIGIEIEEKYCEIAARRCSQEVMELV